MRPGVAPIMDTKRRTGAPAKEEAASGSEGVDALRHCLPLTISEEESPHMSSRKFLTQTPLRLKKSGREYVILAGSSFFCVILDEILICRRARDLSKELAFLERERDF